MPDIDPPSLHQLDPLQTSLNPSSLSLSKPNAVSATAPPLKPSKASSASASQRVDIEPIYTNLKAAIGEHWAAYKEAVGKYVIGTFKTIPRNSKSIPLPKPQPPTLPNYQFRRLRQ